MCTDHHTQSDDQNCIASPAFLNINSFSFKSLRQENPSNSLLEKKLCLLTWTQLENGGNYQMIQTKHDKRCPNYLYTLGAVL